MKRLEHGMKKDSDRYVDEEVRRRPRFLQVFSPPLSAQRTEGNNADKVQYYEGKTSGRRRKSYYTPKTEPPIVSSARPKMHTRYDSDTRGAAEPPNPFIPSDFPSPRPGSGYEFPPPTAPSDPPPRGHRFQAPGNSGASSPFSADEGKTHSNFKSAEELFAEFFGGASENRGGGADKNLFGNKTRTSKAEPKVVELPLPLTLEEIFKGVHKKLKVKRRRFDKTFQEKILEMDIKPGLLKGSKIKFKGVGDEEEEGVFQDLHFIIEEVIICLLTESSSPCDVERLEWRGINCHNGTWKETIHSSRAPQFV